MDKPIYSFEPIKHAFDFTIVLTISLLALIAISIFFIKKKAILDATRRNILIMVLSFIALVVSMTLLVKGFSLWRLQEVKLYGQKITTPYGTTPLSNVKDFYIKTEMRYKPLQPDKAVDSSRYFFLIERNDKIHVLSEGDYPIDSILERMNEVMEY